MWMPHYLEMMGAALERAPEAGFAYTDAWILNDATGRILKKPSLEHYDAIPDPASAGRPPFSVPWPSQLRDELDDGAPRSARSDGRLRREHPRRRRLRPLGPHRRKGFRRGARGGHQPRPARSLRLSVEGPADDDRERARGPRERDRQRRSLRIPTRPAPRNRSPSSSRFLGTLSGDRKASALAWRIRRRLGPVRQRIAREQEWMAELPADVAAALPELSAAGGS